MLNPRALTHAQLAEIVADVQAILWQESRLLPDFPREYGEYWNPTKEWEAETVEEIADVLDVEPRQGMGDRDGGRDCRCARRLKAAG